MRGPFVFDDAPLRVERRRLTEKTMDRIDHSVTKGDEPGRVIQLPQTWKALKGSGPLAQVDAYWHAVRGGRLVPERADVDPRGIEGALSHAFIVERIAPGHARIRIAGTHLGDLMGMEVRGMPLSAMFEPVARPQLHEAVTDLFRMPCVLRFAMLSEGRIGKPSLRATLALYPLRNDLGEISRALGCVVAEGPIGRAPRRFSITHVARSPLRSKEQDAQLLTQQTETQRPARAAGLAEAASDFDTTDVPYLRVVKSQAGSRGEG